MTQRQPHLVADPKVPAGEIVPQVLLDEAVAHDLGNATPGELVQMAPVVAHEVGVVCGYVAAHLDWLTESFARSEGFALVVLERPGRRGESHAEFLAREEPLIARVLGPFEQRRR